jgi:hypothetical protein
VDRDRPSFAGAFLRRQFAKRVQSRFDARMVDNRDPFIREKFTKEHAKEYFERYPKDRYQTEVESWRELQSRNIEFTMKGLREPLK